MFLLTTKLTFLWIVHMSLSSLRWNVQRRDAGRSEVTALGKTHSAAWNTMFDTCSEGYFKTLKIPLLRDRLLSEDDVDSGRVVAVVNQALVRNYFPNDDPIGQSFKLNAFDQIAQRPYWKNRPREPGRCPKTKTPDQVEAHFSTKKVYRTIK
jgi:hypothetical protein